MLCLCKLDAAAVSFAVRDLVSNEPTKSGAQKYAGNQPGTISAPKKQSPSEKSHGIAVDEDIKRRESQVGCDDDARAEKDEVVRPEMTHKEPTYKNARWLRKRHGAPHWTQKICRLLEDLMDADETEAEADMGAVVYELWKIRLDRDNPGQDARKSF